MDFVNNKEGANGEKERGRKRINSKERGESDADAIDHAWALTCRCVKYLFVCKMIPSLE